MKYLQFVRRDMSTKETTFQKWSWQSLVYRRNLFEVDSVYVILLVHLSFSNHTSDGTSRATYERIPHLEI